MAKVYPEHREPQFDSERRVLASLRKLDDTWHVFHNIRWQALRRNRQGDGETDFALFHPRRGILIIEAKGGEVELVNGDFVRRRSNGTSDRISSPFEQAADCKRHMSDFLSAEVSGLGQGPRVGHAVAFPHVQIDHDLGPEGPREIILDSADLADIGRSIHRVTEHWKPAQRLDDQMLARIRQLLLPSVTVKRLLRDEVDDAQAAIIHLTNEQYEVLDAIGGNRQALITGGAGTGKTVLAIERARRLADLGADVLLLCFNRLLGAAIEKEFADQPKVTSGNLHRVIRQVMVDARMVVPDEPAQQWWDSEAVQLFPEAAAEVGFEVDAVVIDEAQDFHPGWWDPLRLVMRDFRDGWFYVFADEQQALYTEGWSAPFDTTAFAYRLTRNCRNTDPIAARVAGIYGSELKARSLDGPKPKFHVTKGTDDAVEKILRRLSQLLEEGITPAQIQVLSTTRRLADHLRGSDVEGIGLVGTGDDGIAVETVHRFKGLEAPVLLIAIPHAETDKDRALAYTGVSRAQTVLEVFGPDEVRSAINWE